MQALCLEGENGLFRSWFDPIRYREHGRNLAVDGDEDRCLSTACHDVCVCMQIREGDTLFPHQERCSNQDLVPVDIRSQSFATERFEIVRRAQSLTVSSADDGLGDGVFGLLLHRGRQSQHLRAIHTVGHNHVSHLRSAFGQRAGFVKGHHADVFQSLQRLAFAEQNAQFRRAAGAHHDGCRRRQTHGAWAGDDKNRHTCHKREAEHRDRTKGAPCGHSHRRYGYDDWYENGDHAIGKGLDGKAGALCFLDHLDNAGEHGVLAHARGLHHQGSLTIERPACEQVLLRFLNWNGLACQHAFIDERRPLEDDAIHRNTFPWLHDQNVAHAHEGQIHGFKLIALPDMGAVGLQLDERSDRGARLTPCAGFKPPPKQDQRDDHSRGFKVDGLRARGQQRGRKQGDAGIDPCRRCAERHQRVHIGHAFDQRRKPASEKLPPGPAQYRCGEQVLQGPKHCLAEGLVDQVMHCGD